MSENENINILLNQLNNSESTELTLSDLVTTVHKSLIYSQHNIRDTELEELKRHYEVEVTESGTSYTSKKLNLDDTDKNEGSLTKQNSLTINEVNMKMKVNLDKVINRNDKQEVVISKYNEEGVGISTELDIKLNLDENLSLTN